MLSSLPKLADRAFIIGFLLPAVLFLVGFYVVFSDIEAVAKAAEAAFAKEALETFVFAAVVAWLLAISLSILNHGLLRAFEGYRFPIRRFKAKQIKSFREINAKITELDKQWSDMGRAFPAEKQKQHALLLRAFVSTFPSEERLVLSTRFGNAIRAFEDYSRAVYGADSIPLWNHLAAILNDRFAQELEDARTHVNSLINLSFLSAVISLLAILRFLLELPWSTSPSLYWLIVAPWSLLTIFGAGAVISRLAYLLAIERAIAWGSVVKAAFDCFLPELAVKLGYNLPDSPKLRRAFWNEFSKQAIFHLPLKRERWLAKKTPTTAAKRQSATSKAKSQNLRSRGK
jgi:hypothetical protein